MFRRVLTHAVLAILVLAPVAGAIRLFDFVDETTPATATAALNEKGAQGWRPADFWVVDVGGTVHMVVLVKNSPEPLEYQLIHETSNAAAKTAMNAATAAGWGHFGTKVVDIGGTLHFVALLFRAT